MKKTLLLAALFVVLGAFAWYALQQKKTEGTAQSPDMEFAVDDPSQIRKIFIADRNGQRAKLERNDEGWIYNDRYPARLTAVQTLLETIRGVRVMYIPPKAAEQDMIKSLAAEGLKVEIYGKNDEKLKCYYVGGVTFDERGTFMIMDGSEQPYVTHIPSFTGQLRVRYLLGDDNWRSRAVFSEKPERIQRVSVEYPQRKSMSFILDKKSDLEYEVTPFYSTTPRLRTPQRKGAAEAYVLGFESLIAESHESEFEQRDSVAQLVPFVIVTVRREDGTERKATFWPYEFETSGGPNPRVSINRYLTLLSDSSFMLTQQRVMGVMFRGYDYFFEGTPTMAN
jgi:hypothetical protein